jgi:NADH-quinone oxidoreductase subunit J
MRNPVHSALMLVVNLFTIAVFYAVQEAQFLAVVQIIVYAGAIMVLFLFVLMLLGVASEDPLGGGRLPGQKLAGVLLGVLLAGTLIVAVAGPYLGPGSVCPPGEVAPGAAGEPCVGLAAANAEGNTEGLGMLLFTRYVWPFEVTSALLVIAAIGAMILGRRSENPADLVDVYEGDEPPPAGPPPVDAPPSAAEGLVGEERGWAR